MLCDSPFSWWFMKNQTGLLSGGFIVPSDEPPATAMNEMTAAAQELARNADDASSAAKAAYNESSAGNLVVQEVIQSINELANEVACTSDTIHHLDGDTYSLPVLLR
jgi:methyl-accepting chemotaxis protein